MYKKLIALLIVCTMLVSIPPAVAADDTVPRPTVEEILNDYHRKAFEAEAAGEASAAAYSPRSGQSGKTLEQETVETLTAAGYEAYNVTGDNYEALEAELNTDFSEMGLDPNYSYVIVISGENPEQPASTGGRSTYGLNPRPEQDEAPDGGGGNSSFEYTHNGITYKMRYFTIAGASNSNLQVRSTHNIPGTDWRDSIATDLLSTYLFTMADVIAHGIPIGTFASLLLDQAQDDNYTQLEPGDITVHAATTWNLQVIQILNETNSQWSSVQCSAYAISQARCAGYIYDHIASPNSAIWCNGVEQSVTNTSPLYYNYTQRNLNAVNAYINRGKSYDETGNINFYLGNEDGEIVYESDSNSLFTHYETWTF